MLLGIHVLDSLLLATSPSPDGIQGMNKVDFELGQAIEDSTRQEWRANINSNNARMGGCFSLILHRRMRDEKDTFKVVDLRLTLEQFWSMRGERGQSTLAAE